ncbi:kinase-like protein, partial [Obba rivulosa]
YCKEAVYWRYLSHENITPFYGVDTSVFQFSLVSQWMSGHDVNQYLQNESGVNHVHLLLGAAQGLNYLHNLDVVHADLKSVNIVIDENGTACLCDFRFTTLVRNPQRHSTPSGAVDAGTPRWKAPELFKAEISANEDSTREPPHTFSIDVFALGMVMWEVHELSTSFFTGRILFHTVSNARVVKTIVDGTIPTRPLDAESSLGLSDEVWNLMGRTWNANLRGRPKTDSVVQELRAQLLRTPDYGLPVEWPRDLDVKRGN